MSLCPPRSAIELIYLSVSSIIARSHRQVSVLITERPRLVSIIVSCFLKWLNLHQLFIFYANRKICSIWSLSLQMFIVNYCVCYLIVEFYYNGAMWSRRNVEFGPFASVSGLSQLQFSGSTWSDFCFWYFYLTLSHLIKASYCFL